MVEFDQMSPLVTRWWIKVSVIDHQLFGLRFFHLVKTHHFRLPAKWLLMRNNLCAASQRIINCSQTTQSLPHTSRAPIQPQKSVPVLCAVHYRLNCLLWVSCWRSNNYGWDLPTPIKLNVNMCKKNFLMKGSQDQSASGYDALHLSTTIFIKALIITLSRNCTITYEVDIREMKLR